VSVDGIPYEVFCMAGEKFIVYGGEKVVVVSVPKHVMVVMDGERLEQEGAGCEEFVVIDGCRYDVAEEVAEGVRKVAAEAVAEAMVGADGGADWWEVADREAGNDTQIEGEWWLSSVHSGLSIPPLDGTTPTEVSEPIREPVLESSGVGSGSRAATEGASWLHHERWKDWIASPFYRKIILYKLRGEPFFLDPAEDIGRNEARNIRKKSQRYAMSEASAARLFYREKTGRLSVCVLETEVPKVCHSLHDVHGHFATGVTLGRAYGEYYWPTRDRDVAHWVSTCIHCQRCHTKLRTSELRPILQFKPMDMLAIDYIGPITPACKGSGARYILVMVDYYSRFVFAQPVQNADDCHRHT
jgi:hypothetical protein